MKWQARVGVDLGQQGLNVVCMPPLLSEEALKQDITALRKRYEDILARLRGVEEELLMIRKEMINTTEEVERKKAKKLVRDL